MDVKHDMHTAAGGRDGTDRQGSDNEGEGDEEMHTQQCTPAPMKNDDGSIDLGYEELSFPEFDQLAAAFSQFLGIQLSQEDYQWLSENFSVDEPPRPSQAERFM